MYLIFALTLWEGKKKIHVSKWLHVLSQIGRNNVGKRGIKWLKYRDQMNVQLMNWGPKKQDIFIIESMGVCNLKGDCYGRKCYHT